ncbi:Os12g0637500, partial [Oryza sativa Japonica Group]
DLLIEQQNCSSGARRRHHRLLLLGFHLLIFSGAGAIASATATGSRLLPEARVDVPGVELPGPPRERRHHHRRGHRHPGDDQEGILVALHPNARQLLLPRRHGHAPPAASPPGRTSCRRRGR